MLSLCSRLCGSKTKEDGATKDSYSRSRPERRPEPVASSSYNSPSQSGLTSNNVGNKLLQKMGWQEGQGLGKGNQGRTTIIEVNITYIHILDFEYFNNLLLNFTRYRLNADRLKQDWVWKPMRLQETITELALKSWRWWDSKSWMTKVNRRFIFPKEIIYDYFGLSWKDFSKTLSFFVNFSSSNSLTFCDTSVRIQNFDCLNTNLVRKKKLYFCLI